MAFNDAKALAKFRSLAEWFLLSHVDGRWEWSFDLPSRDLKAPWISGLTQSLGISVLLREYQLSNDPRYLDVAAKALEWLRKPMEEGGLSVKMSKGVFYEEYPNIAKPSHVLNGHMGPCSVCGISIGSRATKSQEKCLTMAFRHFVQSCRNMMLIAGLYIRRIIL